MTGIAQVAIRLPEVGADMDMRRGRELEWEAVGWVRLMGDLGLPRRIRGTPKHTRETLGQVSGTSLRCVG